MFANFIIRHPLPTAPGHASATVPASAVIHEGDAARVWVLIGRGHLRAQPVVVGDSANGEVKVLKGLSPGATVVSALGVSDREEDDGRAKVEAELGDVPLHALVTAKELLAL